MSEYDKAKVRVPYQPLTFKLKNLAKQNELIIDYYLQECYILTDNEYVRLPREDVLNKKIKEYFHKNFVGDMDYMTLKEFKELVDEVYDFMAKNMNPDKDNTDRVDTLREILKKFENMMEPDLNIIEQLSKKVRKQEGLQLSSNNYTRELKAKLATVSEDANHYIHPEEKVCDYEPDILTVNGKSDPNKGIVITKEDIPGLENVEKNANNYIHPKGKVCNAEFNVRTLNGQTGHVILSQEDLEFKNLLNLRLANSKECQDMKADNLYVGVPELIRCNLGEMLKK